MQKTRGQKGKPRARNASMILWMYNPITGYWKRERTVEPDTADQWLAVFKKAEPDAAFKISRSKPRGEPKKKRNAPSTYQALGHTGDRRTKLMIGTSDHLSIKRVKKPDVIKDTLAWMRTHPPVGNGWVTLTDKRGYRIGTWESEGGEWKTILDPRPVSQRKKAKISMATKKRNAGVPTRSKSMAKKTSKKRNAKKGMPRKATAVRKAMALGVSKAMANKLWDEGKLTDAGKPKKGARGIPAAMRAATKKVSKKAPRRTKKVSVRKAAKKTPVRKSKRPGAKKKGGVCYKKGTKKVSRTVEKAARRVQKGEKGQSGRPLSYQRWCRNFANLKVPESQLGDH